MNYHFLPYLAAIASIMTGMTLVTRLPRRSPTLYLTFDDGPHPQETPRLLETLSRLDIKATFFVVGQAAERHPQLTKAIAEAGHALANHSMTHAWFNRLSVRQQFDEIKSADSVLERFDGKSLHPFRPPHGKWTVSSLVACLLRSQKLVLWSHDSLDYRTTADEVVAYMRSRTIKSGDILLFHDDGPVAREALGNLVPEWKAAGFAFSTIV
jgi:peptidoglycan-N-acetylglucosamine deacetylase